MKGTRGAGEKFPHQRLYTLKDQFERSHSIRTSSKKVVESQITRAHFNRFLRDGNTRYLIIYYPFR